MKIKSSILIFLMCLAGCVADYDDPVEESPVIVIEDKPGFPEHGIGKSGGDPDPCAPIRKVIEINGEEHVMEIPVECHPLEPIDTTWGDDYLPEVPALPEMEDHEQNY